MITGRYRKDTRSGAVHEIEIYSAPICRDPMPKPRPERVRSAEEREIYNRKKSEKHFVRLVNTNFTSKDYYVTLTYDNEHLPSCFEAAQNNLDNYTRRLKRGNPQAKIISVTGYGKKSGRLHHHLIISGVAEADIINKWNGGAVVRAEKLRAHNFYNGKDCGEDFTGLALYMFAHTPTDHKGKRWKQTKSIQQPYSEKPKAVSRVYSESRPPKAPNGFELAEVFTSDFYGSGYIRFKYVRIPQRELNINMFRHRAERTAVLNC